ncbi:MAG TPA: hypothetical protein ENI72_01945 [Rhodospirillales bacterium]|nr:hypothetical protein [Rhodospirillales bacterium]
MLRIPRIAFLATTVFLLTGHPGNSSDLLVSSNQVFSIWKNINKTLVVTAASESMDDDWTEKIKSMPPLTFEKTNPKDVLARIVSVREKVDKVLSTNDEPPVKLLAEWNGKDAIHNTAYLNSGLILDALALHIVALDPISLASVYYSWPAAKEKTPNDTMAVIDLADRRLDEIIKEQGL